MNYVPTPKDFKGIPDISQVTKFKEYEEWHKARQKAASKCDEVVNIARAMIIENPAIECRDALAKAMEFHKEASEVVDSIMDEVGPEPEKSGLAIA